MTIEKMAIKCLIPAAGKGTRMRPFTHTLPKAMLPVAGKPIIYHIIDQAVKVGISDFIIITGYLKDLMESEILAEYPQLNIEFIEQTEQKGLGHACYQARDKVSSTDSLLIIYGDTLFTVDLNKFIQSKYTVIGGSKVEDPRRFGIIELDKDNQYITNLIEKPENPPTNLAIPGVNFFPNAMDLFKSLQYIIDNDIKTKDEYQITDAFVYLLKTLKEKMICIELDSWFDCGALDTILQSNIDILGIHNSIIHGKVTDTKIIDPVYIAKDVEITNSVIGPNVSIATKTQIQNSKIENTIIDQKSIIKNSDLKNSIMGRNVIIDKVQGKVIIGDDSQITS